jgi:putative RNA 2'-phosphotransferase
MLSREKEEKISKFLSFVLRHKPEEIGIELDDSGWVDVKVLLEKTPINYGLTLDNLKQVVENNKKQRFALSDDKKRIRANQGHSVEVALDLPFVEPPEILYHGTATRFLDSILNEGLKPMNRHDVHLSFDEKVASTVGMRHGKLVILEILAGDMFKAGFQFQCSKNNVWLTKEVPVKYIREKK